MKKIFLILQLFFIPGIFAADADILREIRNLRVDLNQMRDDMNKRFEQVDQRFEQTDKRFEQVDKRFETVDKRLDFMQNLIIVIIGLVFTSPFLVEYMARKRTDKDRDISDKMEKLIIALKEVAQKDPRLAKALKLTGLL